MSVIDKALVARIHGRCTEDGDCLLWQGAVTPAGMPWMKHAGNTKAMVRRVLYTAIHGEVPVGMLVSPICGHKRCLAEAHLQAMTPKDSKALAAARGAYKSPARVRKRTATMRAKSRISDAVVESIRQAASAKEAAEQHGVSLPYAYAIRSGAARAELTTPWAGLGA